MYIENVTLPAVPAESNNMLSTQILRLLKDIAFVQMLDNHPVLDYMKVVFNATSHQDNWKLPVKIDTRFLDHTQIEWVKAAIVWYHGAGLDQIHTEMGLLFSPGYQAW